MRSTKAMFCGGFQVSLFYPPFFKVQQPERQTEWGLGLYLHPAWNGVFIISFSGSLWGAGGQKPQAATSHIGEVA